MASHFYRYTLHVMIKIYCNRLMLKCLFDIMHFGEGIPGPASCMNTVLCHFSLLFIYSIDHDGAKFSNAGENR